MAPEEILKNVDPSRRDFVRTVIAGTAFAVPLMTTFSMEGLSVNVATADEGITSLCSNQSVCSNVPDEAPCCAMAICVLGDIAKLIVDTLFLADDGVTVAAARAQLTDRLAQALKHVAGGITGGKNCSAPGPYRAASLEVTRYAQQLADLGLDGALSLRAADILDDLENLRSGACNG